MSKRTCKRRKRATVSAKRPDLNAVTNRVRAVGPERFGLIVVDSSKKNYAIRIGNFYGDLAERSDFPKSQSGMEAMIRTVKQAAETNHYEDMVAGIEMTGTYHHIAKRALAEVCEVKMIHPFTTKQLRQPASSGIKTDDIDLEACTRAMISGYGSDEPELPDLYVEWRPVSRTRDDLVKKATAIKAQCKEKLEQVMPGYASLFQDMWGRRGPWEIVRMYPSPGAIALAGVDKIRQRLRSRKVTMRTNTLRRVVTWAGDACEPLPGAATNYNLLKDYLSLLKEITNKVAAYEGDLLEYLVQTPAVVLPSIQGVNVVSASTYAAELGPAWHYPAPVNITGRAGLFPSRYQSDETDRSDGPIVRGHNARLRQTILTIAGNLEKHNDHFAGFGELRKRAGWKDRKIRFVIGGRFVRISFHMLGGPMFFDHPKCSHRDAVLPKILWFAHEHGLPEPRVCKVVTQAVASFPGDGLLYEIQALETGQGVSGKPFPKALATAAQCALAALWQRVKKEQKGDISSTQN